MAVELEIRDGSPWWASPDILVLADPSDTGETMPVAGTPCYLKARVRNNGTTSVSDATVRFYWANPAIGVTRTTATLIGQAFVSLGPGDVQEALCLTPWVPEFLNDGHECVLAEAFHDSDAITPLPDFQVPTDRHVAQRNLSVVLAATSGMFHFNFEMHNAGRKEQMFQVQVEQVPFEKVAKDFPLITKMYKLEGRKEGKLKKGAFTDATCPGTGAEVKERKHKQESFTLQGHGRTRMAYTGEVDGDFAFINISQLRDGTVSGGLSVLIINP
jgi:hypothetical protein